MKKRHFLLALAVVCASALVVGSSDNSSKAIAGENGHIKVNVDRDKGRQVTSVEGCKNTSNGRICGNVTKDSQGPTTLRVEGCKNTGNSRICGNVTKDSRGSTSMSAEGCKKQSNGGEACVNVSKDSSGKSSVGFTLDF